MAGNVLSRIICKAAGEIRQMHNAAALERIRAPENAAVEELIVAARETPQAEVELVNASAMAERLEAEGLADAVPDADAEDGVAKSEDIIGYDIECDNPTAITREAVGTALSADAIAQRGLMDVTNLAHLQAEELVSVGTAHPTQIRLLDGAQPGNLSGSTQNVNLVEQIRLAQNDPTMHVGMDTGYGISVTPSDAVRTAIAECVAAEACAVPITYAAGEIQSHRSNSAAPNAVAAFQQESPAPTVPVVQRRPELCDDETIDGGALSDEMALQEMGYIQTGLPVVTQGDMALAEEIVAAGDAVAIAAVAECLANETIERE
jgi:hypothetical protein